MPVGAAVIYFPSRGNQLNLGCLSALHLCLLKMSVSVKGGGLDLFHRLGFNQVNDQDRFGFRSPVGH